MISLTFSNGKLVTEEENQLFMSIFKMVSEGDESVVEHFYQEEHEDRPNHKMQIWRDVLFEYVRVVCNFLLCLHYQIKNGIRHF